MIPFRCWFCNRAYARPDGDAGARFECGCGRRAKVPYRPGGSSKVRSLTDALLEALVYGGACALIALVLSAAVFARIPLVRRPAEVVIGATAAGLLAGALFGERALNWLGRKLRDRETG